LIQIVQRVYYRLDWQLKKNKPANSENGEKESTVKKGIFGHTFDLKSPEVQALLKRQSIHADLGEADEKRRLNEVLDVLGKKEDMANQMRSIKKQKCQAFECEQCGKLEEFLPAGCKKAGHNLKKKNWSY